MSPVALLHRFENLSVPLLEVKLALFTLVLKWPSE